MRALTSTEAELKFDRNSAIHPPYDIVKQCPCEPLDPVGDMQAVSYGVCPRRNILLLSASLLFWSRLVHADLAMHATLAALGTLPRARLLTRSGASIAPIQPTTTTAATTAAPKLRNWPLSSSLRYLGTVGRLQQTGRCKKQGCDWGACGRTRRRDLGRSRRRDLATSLALRVRPRRGRTRTRARPSRLRAIAGRKPRDETRPSGEIAKKRLYGAEGARIGMLPAEPSSIKV